MTSTSPPAKPSYPFQKHPPVALLKTNPGFSCSGCTPIRFSCTCTSAPRCSLLARQRICGKLGIGRLCYIGGARLRISQYVPLLQVPLSSKLSGLVAWHIDMSA